MRRRQIITVWMLAVVALAPFSCARERQTSAQNQARALPRTLVEFKARLAVAREQLPQIIRAAEAAADRLAAHPESLVNVPYGSQKTFAEDILNRSGGLANALPSIERAQETTEHDVFLFSVRSWEKDGEQAAKLIRQAKEKRWLVILCASSAGMAEGLEVDYLIDNGAPSGVDREGAINALANQVNAWLWCCEYTSALTRRGKCPGILKSAVLPDAEEHNSRLQSREGRHWIGDCDTPLEPGALAELYLERVDTLVATLAGEPTQSRIGEAAELISDRLATGRKVAVSTCTHFLMFEVFLNNRTPWHPFFVVWRAKAAIPANVAKGDLLVWFSFQGLSTPYEDYGQYIRASECDLIACYVPDADPTNNAPDALCRIEQSWAEGDAEVAIPFPPGRMAPVSGIEQGLLYRMLDAAAADELERRTGVKLDPVSAPTP